MVSLKVSILTQVQGVHDPTQNNGVSSNLYFGLERQQRKQHIKHEPTRDHFLMILKQRL